MLTNDIIVKDKAINILYILLLIPFFVLFPILTIFTIVFLSWFSNDERNWLLDITALSVFILLFQSTRLPFVFESDWEGYMELYRSARNVSLSSFLKNYDQPDYAWYVLTYILCYLLDGDSKLYGELIVCSTFVLTYLGLYNFWRKTGMPYRILITSLVLFTFIPTVIGISNNLLRQQFALSMMFYALVTHSYCGKRTFPLLIFAVLCHTMTIAFIPFYFIKIEERLDMKRILIVIAITCVCSFIVTHISYFTMLNGFYAYDRIKNGEEHQLDDVISTYVIVPYILFMSLLYIKAIYIRKAYLKSFLFVQHLALYISLLCILLINMPLILTRYYISRLFVIPFIVPYLIERKGLLQNSYSIMTIAAIILLFFTSKHGCFTVTFSGLLFSHIWDFSIFS